MAEVVTAFAAMALILRMSSGIWVIATNRMAQVSGLAALQLRLFLIVLVAIVAMVIATRVRDGKHFALTSRLSCAALAGAASGFIGAGIMLALKGTPWPLNGHNGDVANLVTWANGYQNAYPPAYPPPFYPPLFPKLLSIYMGATDQTAFYALKDLQILFTAITGPLAYLAWRLLLRPGWALGIGVVSALAVIEPYKPYTSLVLVTFLPVMIRFIQYIRDADKKHWFTLVRIGVVFGVVVGAMVLMYSGWFRWSALGIVVATLIVFPWKNKVGRKNAVIFGAATLVLLGAGTVSYVTDITSRYIVTRDAGVALVQDDYVYFDADMDPAYFAMWRGDLPGAPAEWPPPGELGGVGLFTALVLVGLAVAVMFGYRRTVVIVLLCVLGGVWFQRMWEAHYMFTTKLVGLYPRTSMELSYILIVLSGFAIYYVTEAIARRIPTSPLRKPPALLGAFVALSLLLGSMASSISDKYMPNNRQPPVMGWLAWQAHLSKMENINPEDWRQPPANVTWPPP